MGVATLVLPRVDCFHAITPAEVPTPADVMRWMTEFVPRFPHAPYWAKLGGVKVWCGSANINTPADLKNPDGSWRSGATLPNNLTVLLNSDFAVRDNLAHELGHCAQHYYSVLPTSADAVCRLMWQAWKESPGPDGEEDFANQLGAHLLGLKTIPFMRNFPLAFAAIRAHAWPISTIGYDGAAIVWLRMDPNGLNTRYERIAVDGQHQIYTDGQWRVA